MPAIKIIDFQPKYSADFKRLNVEWITRHWQLEPADHKALDHPSEHIIKPGGAILLAVFENQAVGSTALIPYDDTTLELAKMAVAPSMQGRGIGAMLAEAALARARLLGATRVYLETNSILGPALSLYRKLGFTDIEDPATPSPYARCNVRMEKAIG